MSDSVSDNLRKAADIFDERNKLYGGQYKQFRNVIEALFPEGFRIEDEKDFNRIGCFVPMVTKLVRYCKNFHKGGHKDSLHDIAVYAMMLAELDDEKELEIGKDSGI